jgi:hypothetical protein
MVDTRGTAVHLVVSNALSELLDESFIDAAIRRHFQPLLERDFATVLGEYYPDGIKFSVNGRSLPVHGAPVDSVHLAIRLPRKRKPAAAGYVFRSESALPEEMRGIAISTLGKVIRRGWDWLGMIPAGAERIGGMIDAPLLADCLTLNKSDFLRTGPRGAMYLAFRKSIQEALAEPLAAWGESHAATEETRRRKARPLERDLRDVLGRMARDFLCSMLWLRADPEASGVCRSATQCMESPSRCFLLSTRGMIPTVHPQVQRIIRRQQIMPSVVKNRRNLLWPHRKPARERALVRPAGSVARISVYESTSNSAPTNSRSADWWNQPSGSMKRILRISALSRRDCRRITSR